MARGELAKGVEMAKMTRPAVQTAAACEPEPRTTRRPPVEEYEKLKRLVQEAEEDIRKAEGGNKAAGTRVRKQMQEIKNAAQEVRVRILGMRGESEE